MCVCAISTRCHRSKTKEFVTLCINMAIQLSYLRTMMISFIMIKSDFLYSMDYNTVVTFDTKYCDFRLNNSAIDRYIFRT